MKEAVVQKTILNSQDLIRQYLLGGLGAILEKKKNVKFQSIPALHENMLLTRRQDNFQWSVYSVNEKILIIKIKC